SKISVSMDEELFEPSGSSPYCTVAVLVKLPRVLLTVPVTVNSTLLPAGKLGITTPEPCNSPTVNEVGQSAEDPVPSPASHVIPVSVNPETAGSCTMTFVAFPNPLFEI